MKQLLFLFALMLWARQAVSSERLRVEQKLSDFSTSDSISRIRQCRLAPLAGKVRAVAITATGEILVGIKRNDQTVWTEALLFHADGSLWARGEINSAEISADGNHVLVVEEQGRFAVLRIAGGDYTAVSDWLPYLVQLGNQADFFNSVFWKGELYEGLGIASVMFRASGSNALLGYIDGRVLEYDCDAMLPTRLLKPSDLMWQTDRDLAEALGRKQKGEATVAREMRSAKNVFLSQTILSGRHVHRVVFANDRAFGITRHSTFSVSDLLSGQIVGQLNGDVIGLDSTNALVYRVTPQGCTLMSILRKRSKYQPNGRSHRSNSARILPQGQQLHLPMEQSWSHFIQMTACGL